MVDAGYFGPVVTREPNLGDRLKLEVLPEEKPRRYRVAAGQFLDALFIEFPSLRALDGRSKPSATKPCHIVLGSALVADPHESIRARSQAVSAEDVPERFEQGALAVRAVTPAHEKALFACLGRERVADGALYERNELRVVVEDAAKEGEPAGRVGVGVVPDGRNLGNQVFTSMR